MSDPDVATEQLAVGRVIQNLFISKLREPGKDDPSRDFVRSFVIGQRQRRVSFNGKKEMGRIIRRARGPVWLEVVAETDSGTRIPGAVTRALMTLIPAPHVIVVPPGVPRASGILGRAFDCGGIRTWEMRELEQQIRNWTMHKRHVVLLLRRGDMRPDWLVHGAYRAQLVRARLMRVGALSGWAISLQTG